ncbi:histidine kinase, partial [Amycolatopsis sp. SID8362]|nr:histidine kinase [Amycolatopsis sp. SID8362]NED49015.1 histidine kinase [Amycolatopsis sp. SID8362]
MTDEISMPAILAAVGGIARELELPSLLERAVTATCELMGAPRGRLELPENGVARYGGEPGAGAVEVPVRAGSRVFGALVIE